MHDVNIHTSAAALSTVVIIRLRCPPFSLARGPLLATYSMALSQSVQSSLAILMPLKAINVCVSRDVPIARGHFYGNMASGARQDVLSSRASLYPMRL